MTLMIISGLVVITLPFAVIDPMGSMGKFLPKCPIKWLTGYDCPGCGSTRALHALLTGHPIEALKYNYFLPIAIALTACSLLAESVPSRFNAMRKFILSPTATYIFIASCIMWWIGRNLWNL